ncbi:MAG: DUF2752 domain-containing protein [Phycisphaerales bacterium]|nr:DUF2752 domain-containing protein [Phycisphaerales bacterium]
MADEDPITDKIPLDSDGSCFKGRLIGLSVALVGIVILGVAASLAPAEAGLGTHRALGLPPCNWITMMDMPCPTCGMTTAFSNTVRGDWVSGFRAQPLGLVFCVVVAMAIIGGLWTAILGRGPGGLISTVWNRWWTWGLVAFALLAWVWKIVDHRGLI